jgi:hypothetical protein
MRVVQEVHYNQMGGVVEVLVVEVEVEEVDNQAVEQEHRYKVVEVSADNIVDSGMLVGLSGYSYSFDVSMYYLHLAQEVVGNLEMDVVTVLFDQA